MRAGRPIQLTLQLGNLVGGVVSLVRQDLAGTVILEDLPNGVVNIPKRTLVTNALPTAQVQNLAGPNWNGNPMLTGRTYDSPRSGGRTRDIFIRNTHAQDSLLVSFDRGVNFFTLNGNATGGESFAGEVSLQFFTVKRGAATGGSMIVEVMAILV